ncbi:hypothetical protein BsWGS_07463 [Bradybaena similaris]
MSTHATPTPRGAKTPGTPQPQPQPTTQASGSQDKPKTENTTQEENDDDKEIPIHRVRSLMDCSADAQVQGDPEGKQAS